MCDCTQSVDWLGTWVLRLFAVYRVLYSTKCGVLHCGVL